MFNATAVAKQAVRSHRWTGSGRSFCAEFGSTLVIEPMGAVLA